MDISDKVSSDTSVTDKQPLLTPNQVPINAVDIIPDEFCALEALRSLKSSFEEALSISALVSEETTILGKHPLTPPPPDQATSHATDSAVKDFHSFNSAFTPVKTAPAPAVERGPHSMSTPELPSNKKARTSRLDKIAMCCSERKCRRRNSYRNKLRFRGDSSFGKGFSFSFATILAAF